MATVTKTWTFLTNANGWADVGDDAGEVFSFTDVGQQCVSFARPTSGTSSERGRTGTGVTWETWGVPSGATVTSIVFLATCSRNTSTGFVSSSLQGRVLNSSNTTILDGGDSLDSSVSGTSYVNRSGVSRNINSSYQASTTNVKAEMTGVMQTTSTNRAIRINRVDIEITYSTSSGGVKFRRLFSNLINRIGSRTVK